MTRLAERILVIDQHAEEGACLVEYLVEKGYDVKWVESTEKAHQVVSEFTPDLIFADVASDDVARIPVINNAFLDVPTVVISEVSSAGDVVACLRKGAADFILKPVKDFASVDKVIDKILENVRLSIQNAKLQQQLEAGNKKLKEGLTELETDQKAALQVQLKMLPKPSREINSFHFAHVIKPSLYLSGDFVDYFNLDEDRVLFYFADVSGHGASSSFITVLLKNLTMRLKRNYRRGSSDELSCPDRFLKRMNQELLASDLGKHVTVFVGLLDKRSRELVYSVGGHFPLPIILGDGQAKYLDGKGMAVGLFPEPQFNVYRQEVPEMFQITVFSDGILEIMPGKTLIDKEKLLLDVVSTEHREIESLLSSLGLDDIDELPDDIAVLTVSNVADFHTKVSTGIVNQPINN